MWMPHLVCVHTYLKHSLKKEDAVLELDRRGFRRP
jgi:hypothetical protein